jgi:hypothetical protein
MRRWVSHTGNDSVAATGMKRSLAAVCLTGFWQSSTQARVHSLSIEQAHNEVPIFRRDGQSTIPGIHDAIAPCLLMEE